MATPDKGAGSHVLGLTGPIGCGKTTVGNILLELGALERIDADRVVHELLATDAGVRRRILGTFGDEILLPDGNIDRRRLGEIVFARSEALRDLEDIVHPAVRAVVRERISQANLKAGVMIVDAVKLLQSDLLSFANSVWVVQCSSADQITRLTEGRGMSLEVAHARINSMPTFEHPQVSQVFDNSGTLDSLRARVIEAWQSQMRLWGVSA